MVTYFNIFCAPSLFTLEDRFASSAFPTTYSSRKPSNRLKPFYLSSNRSHRKITRRLWAGRLGSPCYHCLWKQPGSIDLSPDDVNYQPSLQTVSFFSALSWIPEVSAWSREALNGKLISQIFPVQKLLPGPNPCLKHQGIYVMWGSNYLPNASQRARKR